MTAQIINIDPEIEAAIHAGQLTKIEFVRRQVFWNQCALKLRESLAHLVGLIMQRAGGDASAALRVSFV